MTNTDALKKVMYQANFTQEKLAAEIGMSLPSFNYKLNNKREFTVSEIQKIKGILNITPVQMGVIFFGDEVE